MDDSPRRLSYSFRAYLCSFSTGDLRVQRHGRKIRVEASSTHPSQIYLVSSILDKHARRIEYPIKTPSAFGWRLVYYLSPKFHFLLDARKRTYAFLRATKTFYSAIAGLIDSEGHIGIRAKSQSYSPRVAIGNSDLFLIRLIINALIERGYRASIQTRILGEGTRYHEVFLSGRSATRLLKLVNLRHPEKIRAQRIALNSESNRRKARDAYIQLRTQILRERDSCVKAAEIAFENRGERKDQKRRVYDEVIERAAQMQSEGETVSRIGITLGRSQGTIYRMLRRNLVGKRDSQERE